MMQKVRAIDIERMQKMKTQSELTLLLSFTETHNSLDCMSLTLEIEDYSVTRAPKVAELRKWDRNPVPKATRKVGSEDHSHLQYR